MFASGVCLEPAATMQLRQSEYGPLFISTFSILFPGGVSRLFSFSSVGLKIVEI